MAENPNQNLYFLRLLQQALQAHEPRTALLEAFATIRQLGDTPEYSEGFVNFQLFMKVVEEALEMDSGALDEIKGHLDTLRGEIAELAKSEPLTINITKDGNMIGSLTCQIGAEPLTIGKIFPGEYRITLSNGRLLWSKQLSANELQWAIAFPQAKYPAAAMTDLAQAKASLTESLLGGCLLVEVFPGIEFGNMRISHRPTNRDSEAT
ncbi:MAG: hypothetical protein IPH59_02915 [bacterium]|nr:hypothetical protein [bacterium]